jgi:hypothetical protein
VISLLLATLAIAAAEAQPETVPLQMSGTLGGTRVSFSGRGECHQSDAASIYDVPAAMWHASFSGGTGIEHLNITLWQPKGGGPMQIMLAADAGRTHYSIGTVKGGTLSGSGTARVERQGAGGTLAIQGQTASGAPIQLSVSCSRFTAPEDNG